MQEIKLKEVIQLVQHYIPDLYYLGLVLEVVLSVSLVKYIYICSCKCGLFSKVKGEPIGVSFGR